MKSIAQHRNSLLLAALMTALPIAVHIAKPTQQMTDQHAKIVLELVIPKQFGIWRALDNEQFTVSASTGEQVYDQVLSRSYLNQQGQIMMLTIAYGSKQTPNLKIHRQEVCYTAGGFKIEHLEHSTMTIREREIPVTRMYAERSDHNEQVTYWFTVGQKLIKNRFDLSFTTLSYLFSGMIADGYLIRISSQQPQYHDSVYQAQTEFVQALTAALPNGVYGLLVGINPSL